MAKKKATKPVTRTEFLSKRLSKNPELKCSTLNRQWSKAGHSGTISNFTFYKVRKKLGIRVLRERALDNKSEVVEPRQTGPKVDGPSSHIFQLKITLKNIAPPIWRRIEVEDCTLDVLHQHIQSAMGWTDSHMHHFRVAKNYYADPSDSQEIIDMPGNGSTTETWLSQLLLNRKTKFAFEYEYDFGDSWRHEILYEKKLPKEPGRLYPTCIDGELACPLEDIGGTWGYSEFLDIIADPEHDSYDEMRSWTEDDFDPEEFSAVAATERMREPPCD